MCRNHQVHRTCWADYCFCYLCCTLPGRERSHGKGLTLTPIIPVSGSKLIWRGIAGCGLLAASWPEGSTWHLDCLAVLGRKEYLAPVDPRMIQDYQEVQREETVVLAIVLWRCAIHAGASPSVFCRVVQELHNCLVPMMEVGNLFNMKMEIWEGVRKDPVATTPSRGVPSLTPRVKEPTSVTVPNPLPAS